MRIGSGVQSAPEVFGKRQNNSKTSAVGNEEFSQTSVKVYLKTDDMLFSGGNGTGLSFYIKYAEESTEDKGGLKMAISGVGQSYYQNNVTTMKSTKNVNSTEEFALEKNKRNAGIVGSGRNGIIQKGIL